ncbi:MAG TPA: DUF4124 domain-containing protein, partial [Nitrospinaceae bacterium]|nr:DUF4124 domain-containing protein [Nitrospinaceae bacterium]
MKLIKHTGLFLFVIFMMSANPALAKTYKWVDEKGKAHFTDNPGNIPPQYRTSEKQPRAGKKAKIRVDIGRGYSFEIPGDWKVAKRGSLQNKLIFTKKRDGYEPHCSLHEYKFRRPFEEFKANTKAAIKRAYTDYRIVSESVFSTKDLKGVKIKERFIDKVGKNARRQTYFFHGLNKKNVAVVCQAAIKTRA